MTRALFVAVALALVGCSNVTSSDPPYIRGTITLRDLGGVGVRNADGTTQLATYPRIRVEKEPDKTLSQTYSPKSLVSWDTSTEIKSASGAPLTGDDLKVGQIVSVWITGIVLDSYPDQVGATRIVIEKENSN